MWKWIAVAFIAIVLVLGAGYFLFRKATAGGDTVIVAIGASPQRVWASLANSDSMTTWMNEGSKVFASSHGMVAKGDTLRVERTTSGGVSHNVTWTVGDVVFERVLELQLRNDSTGLVLATRRDSLAARGDSTLVISTIASPVIDSLKTERGDSTNRMGRFFLDIGSKAVIVGFRELSKQDLVRLKDRLEGKRSSAAVR